MDMHLIILMKFQKDPVAVEFSIPAFGLEELTVEMYSMLLHKHTDKTTAAIGKGFAIASAALTALALFAAYVSITGIPGINIFNAKVLAALFIGGMIPVVFSALAMNSVGKAAMDMVNRSEERRVGKECRL